MIKIDYARLVQSVVYFLCFQDKIGRVAMVDEATLKYPVADYLSGLEISASSITVEHLHPDLQQRYIDLVVKNTSDGVERAFEFKIAQDATTGAPEKQRFFNDLMRLHLFAKSNNSEAYFIVAGKHVDFIQRFRSVVDGVRVTAKRKADMTLPDPKGFYSEWFSFEAKGVREFEVGGSTVEDYKNIYSKFLAEYKARNKDVSLMLPEKIKTTCIAVTALIRDSPAPYVGGIWKVG